MLKGDLNNMEEKTWIRIFIITTILAVIWGFIR